MTLKETVREDLAFKLGRVFKPGTPVNKEALFAGRQTQVYSVIDAINQDGLHVALYGERGVGKTSLANVLTAKLKHPDTPIIAPIINCTSAGGLGTIWKQMLDEIVIKADSFENYVIPEDSANIIAEFSANYEDEDAPNVVRKVLTGIGRTCILIPIIDEFDTVEAEAVRSSMADTIKLLSDRNVPATCILIGVADDVESLVNHHKSTERCLVQVKMPRMPGTEIASIVKAGLEMVDMKIAAEAVNDITNYARGLPHYAHLLGLHAGRAGLVRGETTVTQEDVKNAIPIALEKAQASIRSQYRLAVTSSRKEAQFKDVLLACALAKTDEFGYFAPTDVCKPLSTIMKEKRGLESFAKHLHKFSGSERGNVLKKEMLSKGRPRFRFENPLLQPYVILKGLASKTITDNDIKEVRHVETGEQGFLF